MSIWAKTSIKIPKWNNKSYNCCSLRLEKSVNLNFITGIKFLHKEVQYHIWHKSARMGEILNPCVEVSLLSQVKQVGVSPTKSIMTGDPTWMTKVMHSWLGLFKVHCILR